MSARAIRHLVIRGRVQGVGYRAFAEYTALDHGLGGWVRNRRDGAVEAVLRGAGGGGHARWWRRAAGDRPARASMRIDEREGTPEELALRGSAGFAVLPTV